MSRKFGSVSELENLFCHLNNNLFKSGIPTPSHIVLPDKKTAFRYDKKTKQMTVGMDMSSLSKERVIEVYLHEMVHVINDSSGHVDRTANQYHNKVFLDKALSVGLCVGKHKTHGWSETSFSADSSFKHPTRKIKILRESVIANANEVINWHKIEHLQNQLAELHGKRQVKPCFLKYVCKCPPPYNSVRSGRRPDSPNAPKIRCEVCNSIFICEDK